MKISYYIIPVLGILVFLLGGNPVSAQTTVVGCDFTGYLKDLEAVKNSTSTDYIANIRSELSIRKDLLKKIIDCSISETETLQGDLNSLKPIDQESEKIQGKLISELDQAVSYYRTQAESIGNLGVLGSKNLAKKIIDWRSSNYAYLANRVRNFVTWTNNQDIVTMTDIRFNQIQRSIKVFNIKDKDVDSIVVEAKLNLEAAKKLNEEAKESFWEFTPISDPLELIKGSLQSLALTYKNFLDLNESIKKILPL